MASEWMISLVALQKRLKAASPADRQDARDITDQLTAMFPPNTQIGNRDFLEAVEALLLAASTKEPT